MEEVEADLLMESLEAAPREKAERRDGGQRGRSEEAEVDGEAESSSTTFCHSESAARLAAAAV